MPLTLDYAVLHRAARVQATLAPSFLRADAYQAAWVRFCVYDPQTEGGAHLMARHACIDVVRDDKRHWGQPLVDVPEDPPEENEIWEELAQRYPLQVAWLMTYQRISHPTGAQRAKAYRLRKSLREEWNATLNGGAGPTGAGAGDAGRYC